MFILDEKIKTTSFKIIDSDLSEVRLKNNKNYPWIILIPRNEKNISEMFELTVDQQIKLIQEITYISYCMKKYFKPDKINIGSLGNMVSQLHVHIIARFKHDQLWPHSVWQENLTEEIYSTIELEKLIHELSTLISRR